MRDRIVLQVGRLFAPCAGQAPEPQIPGGGIQEASQGGSVLIPAGPDAFPEDNECILEHICRRHLLFRYYASPVP